MKYSDGSMSLSVRRIESYLQTTLLDNILMSGSLLVVNLAWIEVFALYTLRNSSFLVTQDPASHFAILPPDLSLLLQLCLYRSKHTGSTSITIGFLKWSHVPLLIFVTHGIVLRRSIKIMCQN
ncbi:hypothetical protein BT96DRAFT_978988 [Gymnopus androsaceus JB14]|uniref:Uncharacterized protein n=1 Tax=Gymnopus androsaceus JB14 TaxID=1447944 RepID=A0A6A4H652_9AGAR|nr:hypothetical protein BT96DRAFT_978988 [Gymnopus androsaceus JB14]